MNFLAVGGVILLIGLFMAFGGFIARNSEHGFSETLSVVVAICVILFCGLSVMEWAYTKKDKWDTRVALQYAAVGQCKKSQFKAPHKPTSSNAEAKSRYREALQSYLQRVALDNDSRPKDFAFHAKDGRARLYFHCTRDSEIYELTADY